MDLKMSETLLPIGMAELGDSDASLSWIDKWAAKARVLAVARTTHGTSEAGLFTWCALRRVVHRHRFRTLAVEESWATGLAIDRWLCSGRGSIENLLENCWPHYRNKEFLETLKWMREFNHEHPEDLLRFVGTDVSRLGDEVYQAVLDHLPQNRPDVREHVERQYADLRSDDLAASSAAERHRRVDRAQSVVDMLGSEHDDAADWARHNARMVQRNQQLLALDDRIVTVEETAAEIVNWWHQRTGSPVLYWSTATHSSVGHARAVLFPDRPSKQHRNAGSRLKEWFGDAYAVIGLLFETGNIRANDQIVAVRPASGAFAEARLAKREEGSFAIELDDEFGEDTKLRLMGPGFETERDAESLMSNGSLSGWFDAVAFFRRVTPTTLLPPRRADE